VTAVALGLVEAGPNRLRLAVAASALVLLVAAVATAAILLTRAAAPAEAGGSLIRIDPQSGNVTARYRVSAHPGVITTSAGRVWLGDHRDGALWTLEPRTGDLKRVVSLGEPRDLTALGGKIYVAADSAEIFAGTVTRYDAVTGMRERKLDLIACTIAGGRRRLVVGPTSTSSALSSRPSPPPQPLPHREPHSGTTRSASDLPRYGSVWVPLTDRPAGGGSTPSAASATIELLHPRTSRWARRLGHCTARRSRPTDRSRDQRDHGDDPTAAARVASPPAPAGCG
jgi:hypothetical protein